MREKHLVTEIALLHIEVREQSVLLEESGERGRAEAVVRRRVR